MKKQAKRIVLCGLAAAMFWCGGILSDRKRLDREIVGFHIVANSNDASDQSVKLRVRDAVIESLRQDIGNIGDADLAKTYLQEKLPVIQKTAENTLRAMGCGDSVKVTLGKEAFGTRHCDGISLPAGIYDAMRITIGSGEGENWWCVMFPEICTPGINAVDIAAGAGFSEKLSGSMMHQEDYRIRFAVLDALGALENIFYSG